MLTPAYATAHRNAALAIRRAVVECWTSFRTTHRDISTALSISLAVHLALLLAVGASLYESGDDDKDVPF